MIAFEKISAQHFRSNTGFEVKSAGRFQEIYMEGCKQMTVEFDDGMSGPAKFCLTFRPGAFSKWDDGVVLSKIEQLRIEKNFRAAMEFAGLDVQVWDYDNEKYLDNTVQ
jgi:hypothetical protein